MTLLFEALMSSYFEMEAAGLADTNEGQMLLAEALTHVPEMIKQAIDAKLKELGPLPDRPDGSGNHGRPPYRVEDISQRLRRASGEIPDHIYANAYTGTVHRTQ